VSDSEFVYHFNYRYFTIAGKMWSLLRRWNILIINNS
jgi:hypothetical protein